MDKWLEDVLNEYQRLDDALRPYWDRISPKCSSPDAAQSLNEPESVFNHLFYYWNALINSGDVFGYVHFIIEHEADFIAVGANGTLKALAKLMPFYREQQKLNDGNEKGASWWDYWRRTEDERASAEALAEDGFEFARLLLAYAEKNLSQE